MNFHFLLKANDTFHGVLHQCPYESLELKNVTLSIHEKSIETFIPNGLIKIAIKIYNNRDKNLIFFQLILKQHIVSEQ